MSYIENLDALPTGDDIEEVMYEWHDRIKQDLGSTQRFYDFVADITGERSTTGLSSEQMHRIVKMCKDEFD